MHQCSKLSVVRSSAMSRKCSRQPFYSKIVVPVIWEKPTDDPQRMESSTYIFQHDWQNELICQREMFPYSLNSSQPSGNKWRQQNSLEAEINNLYASYCISQSMATILDLFFPIFVITDPKWQWLPHFPEKVLRSSLALVYSIFVTHYRFVNPAFQ